MTNKGMSGKSGKFEIEITHVEVGGRRIPLEGTFRQEGEGNTVATIGAVAVVPVAGFFVTGRSGRMPSGSELTVYTAEDLEVQFEGPAPVGRSAMKVAAKIASEVEAVDAVEVTPEATVPTSAIEQ